MISALLLAEALSDSPGWVPSSSGDWELYPQKPSLSQRRRRRQRPLLKRKVKLCIVLDRQLL